MSINYLNEIISIFLQRDVNELSDKDLSTAIEAKGKVCSPEEIRHVVQSFGSSLFQLRCNREGIFLVRIEPKINICQDFLVDKCSSKPGGCNQLHLCRFWGHCWKKNCRCPHDLNGGNNRRIVEQSNCQNIDPFLLVPLIQLYNRSSHHSFQNLPTTHPAVPKPTDTISSPVQPKSVQRVFKRTNRTDSGRVARKRTSHADNPIQPTSLPSSSDKNYEINVSFPSISSDSHSTIETVESFLKLEGLHVQKSFNIKTNENFHQWTLQLEENGAVDDLLARSVIPYRGFHLKFKRTNPIIDSKCFILQSTIDLKKGPIAIEKFSSYIDILNNYCPYKLTNLSSSLEQILLVECDKIINFDQLRRIQRSRRQVQGRDISLKQVYEIETAIIESIQTSLSFTVVQNIIEPVYENIFTFTVVSNQTAFVEFIHADALKQWLSINNAIKQKFNVDIKLSIKCVDEDDRNRSSRRSSATKSVKSKVDNTTSPISINLSPDWTMVAGHRKFSIEYKNYIRSKTGFEIDIHGKQVQIHSIPTSDTVPKEHPSSLLNSQTSNFMQKFTFCSISLHQPTEQLAILRAHSSIVAFRRIRRNKYLVATKTPDMEQFMQKLLSKQSHDKKPINHPPSAAFAVQETTKPIDQKLINYPPSAASAVQKTTKSIVQKSINHPPSAASAAQETNKPIDQNPINHPPSAASTAQETSKLIDQKPINHSPSAASTGQETTKPIDRKQISTFVIPPPLMNSIFIDDKTITGGEVITQNITLPINTPAQIALFADKPFENHLQIYFNKTYNTKLNIEPTTGNNKRPIIKLVGQQNAVDKALEELLALISLFRTKTFDEMTDNEWVKISDAIRVIQHQLDIRNIICVCQQQTSPISILVHYIDRKHNQLGVSEQVIETICRTRLILSTCKSVGFELEWITLKNTILKRSDYGKDICLFDKQQSITLYGVPRVVKDIQQQFESINKKDENLNYVPIVIQSEPVKSQKPPTEKLSIEKPRDLNIDSPLKSSKSTTHPGNNQIITQKPQTRSISFQVDEPGFEVLINQNFNQLLVIGNSKCSVDKQIIHQQIQIPIPKAKVYEFDDSTSDIQSRENNSEAPNNSNETSTASTNNWFLKLFQGKKSNTQSSQPTQQQSPTLQVRSASTVNNTPSVTIGKSKIIVCIGDLTKQAVDLIVVCSTSKILCDAITSAAGSEVQNAYNRQSSCGILAFETSGGNLPCKHIIFRPWIYDRLQDPKHSIDTFVASIITYGIRHNLTTIAFPSIGCGHLGHDPKIIAEHMIGETYRQLKTSLRSQLIVSFVLLPEQKNVYDAFADQLNMIKNIDDTPTSIPFDKQTVKITLTGSDDNELIECQNKIKQLAQSCSSKLHLTEKTDMADWPQSAIQQYYEYCLKKRVIPTLDIQNSILDLMGPKDAVLEAEKYYFQLTTETLRNARIQVISRGFVWSVEVSPGKLERYSYKINEQIEDARSKNLPNVDFMNEKSERCRIIFSSMEEQYQQRKRKVYRKRIDSSLPNNWDSSGGSFKRVVLSNSSKEYKNVLDQFDTTMKGSYLKIVKIERIQNERWYKQYDAHREDFKQRYNRPDERSLFHGCSNASADKIVQECFNRSFAGANGTLYGYGVYFHEHAKYSHSYTRPDTSSGERSMFLARVLIGKKCIGNSTMKVPPEGFDTTTDGIHIFVVYHDAAAYGEYLITYK